MIVAWHRFALLVACSLYLLGLAELGSRVGWVITAAVLGGGFVLAALVAQDFGSPTAPRPRGQVRHRVWRRTGPYEGQS